MLRAATSATTTTTPAGQIAASPRSAVRACPRSPAASARVPALRASAMAAPTGAAVVAASPVANRVAAAASSAAASPAAAATAAAATAAAAAPRSSSRRLLIVGPGVLGANAGRLWRAAFPGAEVVAQTNTDERHARLRDVGLTPRVRPADFAGAAEGGGGGEGGGGEGDAARGAAAAAAAAAAEKFPYVLFAAPPSGSADYAAEVAAAAALWNGAGCMVFTSSMSVCAVEDGSDVDEACPVAARGAGDAKADRLLAAEEACLQAGGCVLRLVGLYHSTRGAHSFFFKAGEIPRWGGYAVNMLHYEDAADIAVAIMKGGGQGGMGAEGSGAPSATASAALAGGAAARTSGGGGGESGGAGGGEPKQQQQHRGAIFLGCDGHPLTFDAMVRACESSGLPAYQPAGRVAFTGDEPPAGKGGRGKRATNVATRAALGGWAPRYESFARFFAPRSEGGHGGEDWYGSAEGGKGQW